MMAYYLESSALAKRYTGEPAGYEYVKEITDPAADHDIWVSALARVEIPAALMLRVRVGDIDRTDAVFALYWFRRHYVDRYEPVALSKPIMDEAVRLVHTYPLRAYDAVRSERKRRSAERTPAPRLRRRSTRVRDRDRP